MSLINKSRFRRFTLEKALYLRAHKFTRISPEFIGRAQRHLEAWVISEVQRLPSVGKTIK